MKLIEIAITDLDLMVRFRDLNSSVVFEQKHLSKAAAFNGRAQLHCWLMQHCSMIDGLYLEFGVYKGDSINLLADLKPHVKWYGFDSFVGLPETWRLGSKAGAFSVGGRLPKVHLGYVRTACQVAVKIGQTPP